MSKRTKNLLRKLEPCGEIWCVQSASGYGEVQSLHKMLQPMAAALYHSPKSDTAFCTGGLSVICKASCMGATQLANYDEPNNEMGRIRGLAMLGERTRAQIGRRHTKGRGKKLSRSSTRTNYSTTDQKREGKGAHTMGGERRAWLNVKLSLWSSRRE